MGKKHKAQELKQIICNILSNGFVTIDLLGRQLRALDMKQEEFQGTELTDRTREARMLISAISLINDTIHPAHKIAHDLFPVSAHPFIEQCVNQHASALKEKMVNPCSCCKTPVANDIKA